MQLIITWCAQFTSSYNRYLTKRTAHNLLQSIYDNKSLVGKFWQQKMFGYICNRLRPILFYIAQGALNTEGMALHYCSPIQKRNRIVLNYGRFTTVKLGIEVLKSGLWSLKFGEKKTTTVQQFSAIIVYRCMNPLSRYGRISCREYSFADYIQ